MRRAEYYPAERIKAQSEIVSLRWFSIEDGINGMDKMKRSIDYLKGLHSEYFGRGV